MKRVCALLLFALALSFGPAESRNPRGLAITASVGSTIISFSWVPPTQNTDTSAITTGEVTGYQVGIRSGGSAGTYPIIAALEQSTTGSMLSTAIVPGLSTGTYFAAVRTTGPTPSAWSSESTFTVN
jgi:hypothetical protein